jgi:arylsulfatase A-like enzyme
MSRPNLLLLITDQQRYPQHWPDEPGWMRALMPNDAELARTGLSFNRAFCNTCMCTPSRATLFSGQYPAQHGLPLTLTRADLLPDPRNLPFVLETAGRMGLRGEVGRQRLLAALARGIGQRGERGGDEPELKPETQSIAHVLRAAGYHVALKGKWHLTKPVEGIWSRADTERLERDFGFADWDPPDAGENAKAENFGGGGAGATGAGWDEDYTRGIEEWLTREDLPEPFCLVVSLINPHDVLGYPASFEVGGYTLDEVREIEIPLPPTVDEDLSGKPNVHGLMRLGQTAYLGPLRGERMKRDYVSFYAYLHRAVDEKIGRVLSALGQPDDPASLRSRTVIVRCADHGEMGLSHGGLRQKMFNVYEETIRVPLVISSPALFERPAETDALASLVDVFPTLATLAGADTAACDVRGRDLSPLVARHARSDRELLRDVEPAHSVREAVHFTYDDHQAGTAFKDVAGQPNRIRAVRDGRTKYAVYFDPTGGAPPEYELYDLERDPLERDNIADSAPGRRAEMAEQLAAVAAECGTDLPTG